MKDYQCRFCRKFGTRKEVRTCIMTHTKTNKVHGSESPFKSNITEAMIRSEI